MWNAISIVLLVIEAVMLASFAVGKYKKKKLNETFVFLGFVFVINLALYLVPYLYKVLVLNVETNYVFDALNLVSNAVKLFLGGVDTGAVADFTLVVPVFTFTYLLGAVLALLATVSATVEAFSNTIRNSFRLAKRLKEPVCDIVLGNSEMALQYAKKNPGTVLLLGDSVDKNGAAALMEAGYVVSRKSFSVDFLKSRYLNNQTRYNIICPNHKDSYFDYIDIFVSYRKAETENKNVYLYVEIDKEKTETIRREILEHSGCEELVTTFCSNELLARTFAEKYPVTRFMPEDFVDDDASIRPDKKIHVFLLGFRDLSEEICRQMIMNDQFVQFVGGEYQVFPLHYHIYDSGAPKGSWMLGGLEKALKDLEERKDDFFPLPQMPYTATVYDEAPHYRDTLSKMVKLAREENSFSFFIVDTGDIYRNMETGVRLQTMLDGEPDHHIFVRSDAAYTCDSDTVTYYGDFTRIFTHDVIVNDSLSTMAKTLNEVYTEHYMEEQRGEPDFAEKVKKAAEESWNSMDYFTLYSNIHGAMNLRVKLNLLGLDYCREENVDHQYLLPERYVRKDGEYTFSEYRDRSKRNALLAQEHARWNAYHLLAEYLPMEMDRITVKSAENNKVRFNTKNVPAKKHSCLTTFRGLDQLSGYLAETATRITGKKHGPQAYDYYVYDEMLIVSADKLMDQLGCKIIPR